MQTNKREGMQVLDHKILEALQNKLIDGHVAWEFANDKTLFKQYEPTNPAAAAPPPPRKVVHQPQLAMARAPQTLLTASKKQLNCPLTLTLKTRFFAQEIINLSVQQSDSTYRRKRV